MIQEVTRDKAAKTCTITAQQPNEKTRQLVLSDEEVVELGVKLGKLYSEEEIHAELNKKVEQTPVGATSSDPEPSGQASSGEETGPTPSPLSDPAPVVDPSAQAEAAAEEAEASE